MSNKAALVVSRRWKFGKTPTEVFASEMSWRGKGAFSVLDWHGDSPFPSHRRMARMMGCSVSSVRRGLDELARGGWLTRHHRPGTTPVYRLGLPCSLRAAPLPTGDSPPAEPRSRGVGTNDRSFNRNGMNESALRARGNRKTPSWAVEFVKAGGTLSRGDQ